MIDKRCPCGARVVSSELVEMGDGKELFQYKCGVCGSEIGVKLSADPRLF